MNAGRGRGLNRVFSDELSPLALDMLVLDAGDSFELDTAGFETAIVPMKAQVEVLCEGRFFTLKREDVFSSRASSVCLPRDCKATIRASSYSELALCKARTDEKGEAFLVSPAQVREKTVGRQLWERKVVDIIGPDQNASRLVLGETFNQPGGWSSFPPHKHDTPVPGHEVRMEEVYLFRLNPAEGFGTQTIYGEEGSFSFMVGDYDAVTIPWGYHPVSAMPGYGLYYLWFLAGDGRTLMPNTDPNFKWLEER
ncbi:MAG: hypothetical protein A2V21_300565 [Deltaproteobacteria bacterium GWC2_55_46]|nr:MAG: hypothetical protein A2Z79_10640 [Deltaproteobacteria bacterium GWA2_55_82]OGQ63040.1 MAG: hypothetical protein A3I81_06330 [Deltaproteobacteria bacterium RIFCSPLOWO2_02_FULL_55_12]OIJ74987.1 MAG: hypothetical protein A2V21_300565 [Deltaproteobacteria bacterium GWC2_55_46]